MGSRGICPQDWTATKIIAGIVVHTAENLTRWSRSTCCSTVCSLRHLTVKLLEAVRWLSKDTIYAVCGVLDLHFLLLRCEKRSVA